jgi:multimeric flavodoxin WrbA
MKVIVISSSPNSDGLTAKCVEQALKGAKEAGAEVDHVLLNSLDIGKCMACNRGWGTCRDEHFCQVEDDYQKVHKTMAEMDGYIIITPVYWGDMSESAKAFLDRLRRCEATKARTNDATLMQGKPVLCVAAAGGTGNGLISCLGTMERFVDHLKGIKFDFISVTQRSKAYKLGTIKDAAEKMVESMRK